MSYDFYYLYPRLPHPIAQKLAVNHIQSSIEDIAAQVARTHEGVYYAPTGGNRITDEQLNILREAVKNKAQGKGFPNHPNTENARSFDVDCAEILYKKMHLHPSEASHNEIWSFLGCVLLPDIVRWRFGSSNEVVRYAARERGMRRHAFGRLWWRAYISYNYEWEKDPLRLLRSLNEDEFVAVTERPSIASRPALFRSFCVSYLQWIEANKSLGRRELMREASKQMFRQLSLIQVEALDEHEIRQLTDAVFEKTAAGLLKSVQESQST